MVCDPESRGPPVGPRAPRPVAAQGVALFLPGARGAWSFSTIDAVKHIDPAVRIAIVRGEHDPFRQHDPDFLAAGGARVDRIVIPYAGHALKTMILAGPAIMRGMRFLTDGAR